VKLHIQPTVILLSTRVDEGVDAHLDPDGTRGGSVAGDSKARSWQRNSIH